MDIGEITITFDPNVEKLTKAVTSEDTVGVMIRCHLEVERCARHVLSKLSAGRSDKDKDGYKYLRDVRRGLFLLGVPDGYLAPLDVLNKHRNKFAHHHAEDLTDDQTAELFRSISAVCPAYCEEFRGTIGSKGEFDKIYKECSNKEKYVMSTCMIIGLLSAAEKIFAKGTSIVITLPAPQPYTPQDAAAGQD